MERNRYETSTLQSPTIHLDKDNGKYFVTPGMEACYVERVETHNAHPEE